MRQCSVASEWPGIQFQNVALSISYMNHSLVNQTALLGDGAYLSGTRDYMNDTLKTP